MTTASAATATTVAIFGGGIGGLSAALELAERGVDVTVYEPRSVFGGKARSEPGLPASFPGGPHPQPPPQSLLPGEHGFRFFPGFYRHLPDAMRRIPSPVAGKESAFHHLTECGSGMLAQVGKAPLVTPAGWPRGWTQWREQLAMLNVRRWGIGAADGLHAVWVLLRALCSCERRRVEQYEHQSWWEFCGADHRSPGYQHLIGGSIRTFVAGQPKEMSARTATAITIQLLFTGKQAEISDRVLDAPTSEVFIDPWVAHLRSLGVRFRSDATLVGVDATHDGVTSVTVRDSAGVTSTVTADHYVLAIPADRLGAVVRTSDLADVCPSLAGVVGLTERSMNGIQFFLAEDVPVVDGHIVALDAPWALTAISQAQFWPEIRLADRSGGTVRGCLSVDICNFDEPGSTGTPAKDSTPDEIAVEVWRQLQAEVPALVGVTPVGYLVDTDLSLGSGARFVNAEPMLINTTGSLDKRPRASTELPNLYLACDAVRTDTDLASMEAANEAARRAVNALLDRIGSTAARCELWPLREPWIFRPFRWLDGLLYGIRHRRR